MASRDLKDADSVLAADFLKIKKIFEATFRRYEVRPICTHRSVIEQQGLYAIGRTKPGLKVTSVDGVKKKSLHNYLPSRAIDVGIFRKNPGGLPAQYIDELVRAGKFDQDLHRSLYWNFCQLAQRFGHRSGGDWDNDGLPVGPDPDEDLDDPGHFEMRGK